jgi:regulator of RNase E activity RraB
MEHGDPLKRPRRVDHWIYFEVASRRDAFVQAALDDGYEVESAHEDATSERRFCAQLHRVDSVELEEIHDVVMSLMELAEEHDGEYDGWETSVERDN